MIFSFLAGVACWYDGLVLVETLPIALFKPANKSLT